MPTKRTLSLWPQLHHLLDGKVVLLRAVFDPAAVGGVLATARLAASNQATGAVLLLAVALDSVSRRSRSSHGKA